jgi:orotidine-5'-phosphate decarboxylase
MEREMSFAAGVREVAARNNSLVCVGLDPTVERFPAPLRARAARDPAGAIVEFNQAIIEATADLVCAYKPNLAFYLAHGAAGIEALARTRTLIPRDIPAILDAKVNDMASTATAYATAYFGTLDFDAVTLSPYLGADSLAPFLAYQGRGVFILCRTSNPSAGELQDLAVTRTAGTPGAGPEPFYQAVARQIGAWEAGFATPGACGVVAGATYPREIAAIRAILPTAPFLIPGVGEQGGDVTAATRAGCDAEGYGLLINAGRSITYASSGDDFATAARGATLALRDAINAARDTHAYNRPAW